MNKYRRLRMLASLSVEEAAKRIGVTKGNIGHWEAGRNQPRVSRLRRIADVYGCSVADLLDDDDKKEGS